MKRQLRRASPPENKSGRLTGKTMRASKRAYPVEKNGCGAGGRAMHWSEVSGPGRQPRELKRVNPLENRSEGLMRGPTRESKRAYPLKSKSGGGVVAPSAGDGASERPVPVLKTAYPLERKTVGLTGKSMRESERVYPLKNRSGRLMRRSIRELKRVYPLKNKPGGGVVTPARAAECLAAGKLKRDEIPLNIRPGGGVVTPSKAAAGLYRELWSRIGGRPWTYILRDIWHEAEWLAQTAFFAVGAAAAYHAPWPVLAVAWSVYTAGYVSGHLFWGTRYRPGQTAQSEERMRGKRQS